MTISIINPVQATYIFIAIFIIAILFSSRKKNPERFFPVSTTNELKGVAILLVVFGHIGYFLISGNLFLFPMSTISGVGVDLFLFLSGYGLVVSALKNSRTVWEFYKTRLTKLLVPLWLVLGSLFLLDFFVLNKAYPASYIVSSFLGFFPTADLYADIDSPLWYLTLILFYYLIFPLVLIKKRPWVSAIIIFLLSYLMLALKFGPIAEVQSFYAMHWWAFPIGALLGDLFREGHGLQKIFTRAFFKINNEYRFRIIKTIGYCALVLFLLLAIAYTSYYSGVGKSANIRQLISIITALSFVFLFLMKNVRIRLFNLFGLYSYEIYLLHWPILYRYDIFFKILPAWLAMIFYLILFVFLGWLLKKATEKILSGFLSPKAVRAEPI
ncbi:MAG: acyltransferase [Candidatus Paceibacterota bacterium]